MDRLVTVRCGITFRYAEVQTGNAFFMLTTKHDHINIVVGQVWKVFFCNVSHSVNRRNGCAVVVGVNFDKPALIFLYKPDHSGLMIISAFNETGCTAS